MKYTPGPWHVTPSGHVDSDFGAVALIMGGRGCGASDDETAGNAEVVASGPTLIDLLSRAVLENEADGTAHEPGCACSTEGTCWYNEARTFLVHVGAIR